MIHPEHLFHHVCRRCETYKRRCNYRIFNPANACLLEQKDEPAGDDAKAERENIAREDEHTLSLNEELLREDDSLSLSILEEQSPQNKRQAIEDDHSARSLLDYLDGR